MAYLRNDRSRKLTTELDYEEGTHTVSATATDGTIAMNGSYETLAYTKIGRTVTLSGQILIASVASGPTHIRFSVPFTVGAGIYTRTSNSIIGESTDFTGQNLCIYMDRDVAYMAIASLKDNAGWDNVVPLAGNAYYINITYNTDL